ncbi:MAG: acetyltransferase [Granulosicoccus sp.]|nr:acetyltransferase [Granulosicoccus sp.]
MFRKDDLFIRQASLNDASILYQWDEKPHVKAATSNSGNVGFDADWEEELAERDDGTEFFIAEVSGVPVGAMQIIDPLTERSHYWGTIGANHRAIDIWIGEESHLGRGYGTLMMRFAIDRCFSVAEVSAILIDPLASNTQAHSFYRRFGFEFIERRQFDQESDCFVFKLTRESWRMHHTSRLGQSLHRTLLR